MQPAHQHPSRLLAAHATGRGGSWLSLADTPHVPDDSELLALFGDVPGITFLADEGSSSQAANTEPPNRAGTRYAHTPWSCASVLRP
jgi:hypothetical protein